MLKFRKEVSPCLYPSGDTAERLASKAPEPTALDRDHIKSALRLRLALLGACALAAAAGTLYAGTGGIESADPDLAKLLKGMAIVKTVILLAAGGAIWCRLGSPVLPASAAGYIIFGAAGIAAAALVWNMASRIDASEKQA